MKKILLNIFIVGISTYLFAGDLVGTVTFNGTAPKSQSIPMDSDPVCSAAHKESVMAESFIVDEQGHLSNVFVYLKNAPKTPVTDKTSAAVLDQNGCVYYPHVLGLQVGQELKILNSDPTMHNIHGLPKKNKEFNFGMPKIVKQKSVKFDLAEEVFVVKCDVHPWMKSYIQVFDHCYFAVTRSDGKFSIKGIPAGEYEVVAWQEKFGSDKTLTKKVKIGDGSTTMDFVFEKPSAK